jgi:hypothetical protein
MNQNLDKNKIYASVRKAKQKDLVYLTVSAANPETLKDAISELSAMNKKFDFSLIVIKNSNS